MEEPTGFQSFDEIIASKHRQGQGVDEGLPTQRTEKHGGSGGRPRHSRNPRMQSSYDNEGGGKSPVDPEDLILAIKMLITNSQAGALIGAQGSAVKELIQISTARVSVSEHNYPGTAMRTVYITGDEEAIGTAASLVVELVAQEELAKSRTDQEPWTWTPRVVHNRGGRTTNVDVEVTITVPASSAGLLLGKGGSNKRGIEDEAGVALTMSDKSDPCNDITMERTMTITGKTTAVINAVYLIIDKLNKDLESCQFVVRGTTFGQGVKNMMLTSGGGRGAGGRSKRLSSHSVDSGEGERAPRKGKGGHSVSNDFVRELSATQVVELAVHDTAVGSILGPGGSKLRDIMSLSGAQINVSNRGDFMEGTRDRRVTIEGSPSCVKSAKELVLHILSQNEN